LGAPGWLPLGSLTETPKFRAVISEIFNEIRRRKKRLGLLTQLQKFGRRDRRSDFVVHDLNPGRGAVAQGGGQGFVAGAEAVQDLTAGIGRALDGPLH